MKTESLTRLVLLLLFTNTFPGHSSGSGIAARGMSLSGAGLSDEWSTVQNPAGLTKTATFTAGFMERNRYGLKELTDGIICLAVPVKKISLGFTLSEEGFDAFQDHRAGIGAGIMLSRKFSIGLATMYNRRTVKLNDLTRHSGWNSTIGFLAEISNKFEAALTIRELQQVLRQTQVPSANPISISTGFNWKISVTATFFLELTNSPHQTAASAGIEYRPVASITCRAGYRTDSNGLSFGAAFNWRMVKLQVAAERHPYLGTSWSAGMTFRANKK